MLSTTLAGHSLVDWAIAFGAIGYVVSVAKDWRPIRTLRAENKELQKQRDDAMAAQRSAEAEVSILRKATDLTILQQEHKQLSAEHQKITATLELVVGRLEALDGAVRANTAAVEMIARQADLKQALGEAAAS